ncbi:non-homologous end joining protein Ku [Streptomyces meridianus]|uniref:Non-homologous end joining protein Ku n=1 Tax=Streptomyces meridianus TaxID=2938945 RepID=A0ABT0X7V5_9ACTN|nr:Ku protein [Streptomyces meridianus]MCM2578603.1 Ku protein [Streptomyces meridianus]
MARAVWSGALSFGLVAIPVQLFTATESHTVHFNQIQRGTSDRVRNKRVNERTGEEVPPEEIVKGFDMGDSYVVVEPAELDEIAPSKSMGLEITGFVDLDEVEPIFFDKTYYLGPKDKQYGKVYSLLLEALTRSNKAGIATVVMRNREYLVALKAEGDVLTMHTLHWADEVRDPRREIGNLPERTDVSDKELQTAVQLIEALSMDWDPEEFHDTYRDRVMELVEAKRTGETFEKGEPPPRSTNVIDLMDALQASVDQAKGSRGAKGGAKKQEEQADKEEAPARPPTRLKDAGHKRRTPAASQKTDKKAAKASELEGLSKTELYHRAADAGVHGRSTMSRDELIKALSGPVGRRRARAS